MTNSTRAKFLALSVFVTLAIVHTWPLAAAPAHWSRVDPGDGALNVWTVGWVAHTLTHHPTQLFDANIFYPEHLTLAYSEAMIVQGVVAAPVMLLGGSAVLAYNVSLLAGFALTGWAFCLLAHRWTGRWSAGYVAGSLAAFNAHSLAQITHMQFLHPEFIAVMLFALDRLMHTRRTRDAVMLGFGFALQGLTSVYMLVFAAWTMIFAVVARIREWWRDGGMPIVARLATSAAVAALVMAPYLFEYVRVHDRMGFVRTVGDEEPANVSNYLATTARVHYSSWSQPFVAEATSNTFPGILALLLVILAWCDRRNTSDARFRMCMVVAAGCVLVSVAPLLPFYPTLHRLIPLFQAVRVLAHIGHIVLLMIALAAAYGVATLAESWPHRRSWSIVATVLVLLVNGEALRAPMGYVWFDGIPAIYDVLANDPKAVIAELPFPLPQQWFVNTPYMVNSTRHWRPMLNGYSGFRPNSYEISYEMIRALPSPQAVAALRQRGVTHLVVHQRALEAESGAARFQELVTAKGLDVMARDGDIVIVRLTGS